MECRIEEKPDYVDYHHLTPIKIVEIKFQLKY